MTTMALTLREDRLGALLVVSSSEQMVEHLIRSRQANLSPVEELYSRLFVGRRLCDLSPQLARNAAALFRLLRQRRCDVVHAHGRTAAWSAFPAARMARTPFLTSWYKGFREQNVFKHAYNGVMARGERVIVPSDQIAELIVARHHVPRGRIAVIPPAVDLGQNR